jgi:tetratricopeptide (TPR) repeat protein
LAALLNAAANQDTDQQQQLKTELDALPKSPRGNRKEARKLNELALEQFKLTDYKAAIGLFEQAVAADAADVEILNNLGYAQLKDQQLKQAEATLWQTLSKQSGRAGAWANLAEVFALKGEQAAAIAAWRNTLFFSGNPDKTRQVLTNQRDDANTPAAVKTSLQAVLGSGQ